MVGLIAYPVANKQKCLDICTAFVQGCGSGYVATDGEFKEGADAAFFYGVDASNERAWRAVRARRQPFYYCDNAYFDQAREKYFRITYNQLQCRGTGKSDGKRFRSLKIDLQPWQYVGKHIVLCQQSDHFMRLLAGVEFDWLHTTVMALSNFTDRPVRVRNWRRDKRMLATTLGGDLRGAHALVTWSSAAAIMAVVAGIPIVVMGPSAAAPMAGDIADIESLPRPAREQWCGVLADNQWTVDEMREGRAWKELRA